MLGPATRQVNADDRVTWNANCQLAIDRHYTHQPPRSSELSPLELHK